MITTVHAHLHAGDQVKAGHSGRHAWLEISSGDDSATEFILHLGCIDDGPGIARFQGNLRTLVTALQDLTAMLPGDPAPATPDDDPTDDDEDGPAGLAGPSLAELAGADSRRPGLSASEFALFSARDHLAAQAARSPWCVFCGHGGHPDPRAAGCPSCNDERPMGACHSVAALVDALALAEPARRVTWAESELRAAWGDR